jgi:hypothetical protein
VQGLRCGALRARALEEKLQGLRHGPLRAETPEKSVVTMDQSILSNKH